MLPLPNSLSLLAAVATLRGRHAEAVELSRVAERIASEDGSAAGTDSGVVREALAQIRDLGPGPALEEALTAIPQDLHLLAQRDGLDVAEVASLYRATGATSLGEMMERLGDEQIAGSLDPALLGRAAPAVRDAHAARRRVPLGRAWSLLEPILAAIRDACPEAEHVEPTGSFRRFAAMAGDLEVLVASTDPTRPVARLLTASFASTVLHAGPDRLVVRFERAELTIRIVSPGAFIPRLVTLTGSADHVRQLRERARNLGMTFTS